jgi:hypothetical protein
VHSQVGSCGLVKILEWASDLKHGYEGWNARFVGRSQMTSWLAWTLARVACFTWAVGGEWNSAEVWKSELELFWF